jgi:D-alanyl-D-alanine carboxypeptidase/D-alanyl-D-alanine-endopeptidase (penicillin-binding protein 4)
MHNILLLLFFSSLAYAQTTVNYALVDIESGEVLEKKNANTPGPLASVSKIFTIHYALSTLGPNERLRTEIHKKGEIKKGILKGALILKGVGDPFLTVQDAISLIHQLKNRGINKVSGNFVVDDTYLPFTPRHSDLGLEDQADNPSIGSLNMEFNRFEVLRGNPTPIPPLRAIQLRDSNTNQNGLKFKNIKAENSLELWERYLGEKHKYTEELPTRDATMFTAHFFHHLAQMHGLELPTPTRGLLEKPDLVAFHESKTIEDLSALAFEYSNNLIAQQLMLNASKELKQNFTSEDEPIKTMMAWLKEHHEKLKWEQTKLVNGSGLDHASQTTPLFMASFLKELSKVSYDQRSFWSLLSINGHSGGIAKRLKIPRSMYRIYGKTGSLHFVNNLAGYLLGKNGKQYAYAIFTTDAKKRDALKKPNSAAVNIIRKEAKSWHQSSTVKIDAILLKWLNKY